MRGLILVGIAAAFMIILASTSVSFGQEASDEAAVSAERDIFDARPAVRQQSRFSFNMRALGGNGILTLSAGAVSFLLCLMFVKRGGPNSGVGMLLAIAMPLLLATYFVLSGMINSYSVIAISDTQIKASEFAEGLAATLLQLSFAMVVTVPAFLTSLIGITMESLRANPRATV